MVTLSYSDHVTTAAGIQGDSYFSLKLLHGNSKFDWSNGVSHVKNYLEC